MLHSLGLCCIVEGQGHSVVELGHSGVTSPIVRKHKTELSLTMEPESEIHFNSSHCTTCVLLTLKHSYNADTQDTQDTLDTLDTHNTSSKHNPMPLSLPSIAPNSFNIT